jgi:hypothetical protein
LVEFGKERPESRQFLKIDWYIWGRRSPSGAKPFELATHRKISEPTLAIARQKKEFFEVSLWVAATGMSWGRHNEDRHGRNPLPATTNDP